MTPDELTSLAVSKALDLAQWMFPEGRREKAEWLVPLPESNDPTPVLSINVGLRAGHWKDLVTGEKGADLFELYALQFDASREAAMRAIAVQLGVTLGGVSSSDPVPAPAAPDSAVEAPHPADVEKPRERALKTGPGPAPRMLPAANDAEMGVLSCFMQNPTGIGALIAKRGVTARHFHHPAHAEIYDHLFYLWGERMECDFITLTTHFASAGRLEQIGGGAYLSQLYPYAPSLMNVGQYVDKLEEMALAREAISIASRLQDRAYSHFTSAELREIIAEFKEQAEGLTAKRGVDRLPPLKSIATWEQEADLPAEPPQVLAGMLHQGSKLIIAAPSKGRKSWTLLDMAASVANGADWWGIPTVKGRVLYLNFEVQEFAIARRLRWICNKRGLAMTDNLQVMTLRGITTPIEQLADELIAYILACPPFSLIVVDPVFKLMAGRDENKVGDVMIILQNLEKIAVRTAAAIAIAHHYSKGNQASKESIDRMGGSGAFARDPDAILMMTTHEEEECFTIEPTLRNFAPVSPFVVRWSAPVFERAPNLDPEALKQPKKPERAGRAEPRRDDNGEPIPMRPPPRANDVVEHAKELLAPFFKEQTSWRYSAIERVIVERRLCPQKTFERWWMRLRKANVVVMTKGMPGFLEPSQEWGIDMGLYPDPNATQPTEEPAEEEP